MRPRHYCRGDAAQQKPHDVGHLGFNEAAALLPRRSGAPVERNAHAARFNEAAALLPRRYVAVWPETVALPPLQ